jgi:hypothetical protein
VGRYVIEVIPKMSRKIGTGGPTPTANEYVLMRGEVEERCFASEYEAARWAADAFKAWNAATSQTRSFPNDRMAVLAWIAAEGVLRDYDLFARVAEILGVPAPTRAEFQAQAGGFDRDHPLACPKCQAPRDSLRIVYPMQAAHRIHSASTRLRYLVEDNYWEEIEGTPPQLQCLKCRAASPLPTGSTVIMMKDGTEDLLFAPDES